MSKQNKLVYLETARILPHPKNPRKELGNLTEMAESVKANGIMQNLTVVEVGNLPAERIAELGVTAEWIDGGYYMVVIGHRRLGAAKLAGLSEVPCVISDMSYEDQLATMVTENLQRTDLTPVEQAQGLRQLSMELGLGAAQIAEKTGISETTVRRRLKVAAIPADQLEKAAKGKQISIGDLEKVGEINDEELRRKALESIGTHNFEWNVINAKKVEKERVQKAAWREVMEGMAIREITHDEWRSREWTCVVTVALSAKACGDEFYEAKADGRIKPEWEIGYYFDNYPDTVNLYAKTQETPAEDPNKSTRKTEYNARNKTMLMLKDEFDSLSEKRLCFVCGLTSSETESVFGVFMAEAVRFWANNDGFRGTDAEDLKDILGGWMDEESDINESGLADVMRDAGRHPVQTALWVMYRVIEEELNNEYPFSTWQYDDGRSALTLGDYRRDDSWKKFDDAYRLLEAIGYEVDPWERALLDGTSSMYYVNGGKDPGEAQLEAVEEQAAVPDVGGIPMTRFDALKALTKEELAAYVAAFDRGRDPERAAELLTLIPKCETADELFDRIYEWFCCDIPCPEEDEETIGCNECILRWLKEERAWTVEMLMDSLEDGDSEDV